MRTKASSMDYDYYTFVEMNSHFQSWHGDVQSYQDINIPQAFKTLYTCMSNQIVCLAYFLIFMHMNFSSHTTQHAMYVAFLILTSGWIIGWNQCP